MKTKRKKILIIPIFAVFLVGGVALAADISNEITGYNSVNKTIISVENGTKIEVENNAAIDNEIDLKISTGENTANGNTGDGSVKTGDIDVSLSVTNEVNYCSINSEDGDNDNETTTTTTTNPKTTVITSPSGGTIKITTSGGGVNIHTSGYSGSFVATYRSDGVEQTLAESDNESTDNEIIALGSEDIKGADTGNVLIGDEQNCPWCIAIVIALAVLLGGYGFYLSRTENPKGILGLWYLWPAVFGYLAWIVHTIAHYGTGIGWFAEGYDKVIIAEIVIAYLAFYAIRVRHQQKIHKAV